MNLFVPCFDEFQKFIDEIVERNPGDKAVEELKVIVEQGANGMGVYQISGDGSNIQDDEEVFTVVQLHETNFSYPDGFFDKWTLVVTLNFPYTRMDVFCCQDGDAQQVYKDLQADMMQNAGIQIQSKGIFCSLEQRHILLVADSQLLFTPG